MFMCRPSHDALLTSTVTAEGKSYYQAMLPCRTIGAELLQVHSVQRNDVSPNCLMEDQELNRLRMHS